MDTMKAPKSVRNRFTDEQRDFLGALLFHVLHSEDGDARWEGIGSDRRRLYRHQAMSMVVEVWKFTDLDALLDELAPEEPLNQDEQGGCVWCAKPIGRMGYGYSSRDLRTHMDDCPWIKARRLRGDQL